MIQAPDNVLFWAFWQIATLLPGVAARPFDTKKSDFYSDKLAGGKTAAQLILSSVVTDLHKTCPQCEQPIFVEKGKISTCLVCNASQVHDDRNSNAKWRCPNCNIFFQAAPREIVSCPNCRTNQIHPVQTMVLISGYQITATPQVP